MENDNIYIDNSRYNDAPPVAFELFNDSDIINKNKNKYNIFNNSNNSIKNINNMNNYEKKFNDFSLFSNKNNSLYNNNKINNIPYVNQNKNNIFYNNKIESDKHKISINISPVILKNLSIDYLLDLILFINGYCETTIEEKYTNFKHDIFKIEKNIRDLNEYFIIIKKEKNEKNKNINIKNENDKKGNNIIKGKKDNCSKQLNSISIINDKDNQDSENKNNIFVCSNHNRKFKNKKDYMKHCMAIHKFKCEKCSIFFGTKTKFNKHSCIKKNLINNFINNIIINGKAIGDNQNNKQNYKVRCLKCNLIFDNIDLANTHYNILHKKKREKKEKEGKEILNNKKEDKSQEDKIEKKDLNRLEVIEEKKDLKKKEDLKQELKSYEDLKNQENLITSKKNKKKKKN